MYTFIGVVTTSEESWDEFHRAARKLAKFTKQQAGCIKYDLRPHHKDKHTLVFYHEWSCLQAWQRYIATDAAMEFEALVSAVGIEASMSAQGVKNFNISTE